MLKEICKNSEKATELCGFHTWLLPSHRDAQTLALSASGMFTRTSANTQTHQFISPVKHDLSLTSSSPFLLTVRCFMKKKENDGEERWREGDSGFAPHSLTHSLRLCGRGGRLDSLLV